jgi:hypothetical protein
VGVAVALRQDFAINDTEQRMGIFSAIMDKLRRHGPASTAQAAPAPAAIPQQQPQAAPAGMQGSPQGGQQAQAPMQDIDVEAVLEGIAANKGGGGNYKQSIVDLLKLLDLDSSMSARKELAEELGVNAGAHGSAEQNIALHKAVMKKIEENGGKVPDSMRH